MHGYKLNVYVYVARAPVRVLVRGSPRRRRWWWVADGDGLCAASGRGVRSLLRPFTLKDHRLMGRQDLGLEQASVRARTWERLLHPLVKTMSN